MTASARLGSLSVGDRFPVRIMAAVNASPESFYKGSVAGNAKAVSKRVRQAVEGGADVIDIGGASTAPYLEAGVSEGVERSRVLAALGAAMEALEGRRTPISVDTVRASVADAALRGGASIVNDVSGLNDDPLMPKVVRERGASLLAMAHSKRTSKAGPIAQVRSALGESLRLAERAGIEEDRIALDPGIGFFRDQAGRIGSRQTVMPWYEWDCEVVANLRALRGLGRPLGIGLSRKSFLGKILGLDKPEDRLAGSLAVTAIAVMNGANLVRTHDVRETLHAVRAAEAVSSRGPRGRRPS